MSSSYSGNQYENAFKSQKLLNWTVPKHFKERPSAAEGRTTFIASDRGHLLPGVKVKRGSAWPEFRGTWELPARIPAGPINPTGRSEEGRNRLSTWGLDPQHTVTPHTHGSTRNTARPAADGQTNTQTPGEQSSREPQDALQNQTTATPTSSRPVTRNTPRGERPVSQGSQAGERPATQPRPVSQGSQVPEGAAPHRDESEERPATQHSTRGERPASHGPPTPISTQLDQ